MDVRADEVREFFETMAAGGPTAGADLFHDPFVSLDPANVAVVGREQLRAVLPARERMFAAAGLEAAPELREVETAVLDDLHVLARATWHLKPGKPGAEPVVLESSYLLRREGQGWTAVVYLNHHDVRQLVGGA